MDNPSPIDVLAVALRRVLDDPNTPEPFRRWLFSTIAQLRDTLPPGQQRGIEAAEAEAVIYSFASGAIRTLTPQDSRQVGHEMRV